jgi:hypothetical protein
MTTATQIKRLIKPLLQRYGELALIGQWIVLKPVHHVVRGVLIDRSWEANRFRPTWAVVDLVERLEVFPINWGQQFAHPTNGSWKWDDPTIQEALIEALEQEVLPLLRPIVSLDDFVGFATDERFRLSGFDAFLLRKIVVDVARGDLESARSICANLATGRTRWSGPRMREEFDRIMQRLCPLLAADDRAGLVLLLREWEAYSVKNLKLETVWEPLPFPLEQQVASQPSRA